jgi:hypothetical protein
MNDSWKGRALALVAGVAFAVGGLTILLDKDLTSPMHWQASQWLTILTVFGTITAGHLMAEAWRTKGGWPSAIGFLVLFISGTSLVVYSSVGRQVETANVSTLSAEDTNEKISTLKEERTKATARKDFADAEAAKEIAGYPDSRGRPTRKPGCGSNCKDWQQNSKDVSAAIESIDRKISALGPQRPVNAKAEAMAEIAMLLHVPGTKDQIVAALVLLMPFATTLFFEVGSIVAFGFAFRQGKRPILVAANDCRSVAVDLAHGNTIVEDVDNDPEPPKGKRKPEIGKGVIDLHEHRVWKAIEANGGSVNSHRELSQLLGIDEGAASRLRQEIEDHLQMTKVGKQLRIALRA